MRSGYCRVSYRLHTGRVGRSIRGEDRASLLAQSLAGYLCACPHGNALGIFHLPTGYVAADRGWSEEAFRDAISILEELDFCRYDHSSEWVWVVDLFRHEMGPDPDRRHGDGKKPDSRLPMIRGLLEEAASGPFLADFRSFYTEVYPYLLGDFNWPEDAPLDGAYDGAYDAPSTGLARDVRARRARPGAPPPPPLPLLSSPPPPPFLSARATPQESGEPRAVPAEEKKGSAGAEKEEKNLDAWLESYPRHRVNQRSIREARKLWSELPEDERPTPEEIKSFLAKATATEHWRGSGGQWVPGLKKFILQRIWTEDPATWASRNGGASEKRKPIRATTPVSEDVREKRRRRAQGA